MGTLIMTNKTLSTVTIILFIAALIIAAVFLAGIVFPENRVVTPRINPVVSGQPPVPSTFTYPFKTGMVTISLHVNGSVYEGARNADKTVTIIGNVSEKRWITDSYRAMVNDPAQEELYRELLNQFRRIKAQQNLDDDEYLELMAVYVQSLKYETGGENPAKFPVETVVDKAGDCDDKSLLLAGLLSREGYSVALLSFDKENHMAIGVGSDEYRYGSSNYTFLETTNVSFVGLPTEKLGNGIPLHSSPVIIPIGNGIKTYHQGVETRSIHEIMELSQQRVIELEPQIISMQGSLSTEEQEIQDMETRLLGFRNSGNVKEYNAMVSTHNTRVSVYNSDLNSYKQLFARYEKYVKIYNYIINHEYDRSGVYQYIKTNMPG
jgi:hypothetical protein